MEKAELNVQTKDGVLIIREGKAPKINEPLEVHVRGALDSPSNFIKNQPPDTGKAVVLVNEEKGQVAYLADPSNELAPRVLGELKENPELNKFRINSGETFDPDALAKVLKMNRFMFQNKETLMEIVATLKNLDATIDAELKKHSDERGNLEMRVKQTVKSNLPTSLTFFAKPFVGMEKVQFPAELGLQVSGTGILITIDSPDLKEKCDEYKSKLIEEELSELQEANLTIIKTFETLEL